MDYDPNFEEVFDGGVQSGDIVVLPGYKDPQSGALKMGHIGIVIFDTKENRWNVVSTNNTINGRLYRAPCAGPYADFEDADPQNTLAACYNPQGPMRGVPVVAEPEERVDEVIGELHRRYASVIVDTAGFRNRTAITALVATDLAIIPVKPAVEDIDAAVGTFELIKEINDTPERASRPIRSVMVLTMTMAGTVIARHARAQLTEAGYPLLKAEMAHRVAYPEAGIEGLSPSIVAPDGPAARDVAAIAHEIMK
ncbi:MAG: ParA family protein [Candidatus Methylacidiphilaceae bacterium]